MLFFKFCFQFQLAPLDLGALLRGSRPARRCPAGAPSGGRDYQMLLATSSTRISNPRFLDLFSHDDVAGNILQGLPAIARHVIDTHFEPSFSGFGIP